MCTRASTMVAMEHGDMQNFITADVDVHLHHLRCDCVRVSSVQGQEHVCIHAPHCPGGAEDWGNQLADIMTPYFKKITLACQLGGTNWGSMSPHHTHYCTCQWPSHPALYLLQQSRPSLWRRCSLYLFLFITIILKVSGVLLTAYHWK